MRLKFTSRVLKLITVIIIIITFTFTSQSWAQPFGPHYNWPDDSSSDINDVNSLDISALSSVFGMQIVQSRWAYVAPEIDGDSSDWIGTKYGIKMVSFDNTAERTTIPAIFGIMNDYNYIYYLLQFEDLEVYSKINSSIYSLTLLSSEFDFVNRDLGMTDLTYITVPYNSTGLGVSDLGDGYIDPNYIFNYLANLSYESSTLISTLDITDISRLDSDDGGAMDTEGKCTYENGIFTLELKKPVYSFSGDKYDLDVVPSDIIGLTGFLSNLELATQGSLSNYWYVNILENEGNLSFTTPILLAPQPSADLQVLDIVFSDDHPYEGECITISAVVKNNSTFETRNVDITFYSDFNEIGARKNLTFKPNETQKLDISWKAVNGIHEISVVPFSGLSIISAFLSGTTGFYSEDITARMNVINYAMIVVGALGVVIGIIIATAVVPSLFQRRKII